MDCREHDQTHLQGAGASERHDARAPDGPVVARARRISPSIMPDVIDAAAKAPQDHRDQRAPVPARHGLAAVETRQGTRRQMRHQPGCTQHSRPPIPRHRRRHRKEGMVDEVRCGELSAVERSGESAEEPLMPGVARRSKNETPVMSSGWRFEVRLFNAAVKVCASGDPHFIALFREERAMARPTSTWNRGSLDMLLGQVPAAHGRGMRD